jgi:hypothetical protein
MKFLNKNIEYMNGKKGMHWKKRWKLWLNDEVKKMNILKTSKLVQITLMKAIDSEDELTLTLNITSKTCCSAFPTRMFTLPNFSINLLECISYKNV